MPDYEELDLGSSDQDKKFLDPQTVINQLKRLNAQPQRPSPTGAFQK